MTGNDAARAAFRATAGAWFVVLFLTGGFAARAHGPGHEHAPSECLCEELRATVGGICQPCGSGWIAGTPVPSPALVDALDPWGHVVDVPSLECASCRDAAERDAICPACGWGIVDGRIYGSLLTYRLAAGQLAGGNPAACSSCADRATAGWCDACHEGRIGPVRYADSAGFQAALTEFLRLQTALTLLPRCETCAIAHCFGSRCNRCGIPAGP